MATPSKPKAGSSTDDFDAQSAIKTIGDTLEQPHLFAEKFCAAAKSQTQIKEVLKELIRELLQFDPQARETLKEIIREIFKENWKAWIRSVGGRIAFAIWTLATLAFGAWITSVFMAG